MKQNLECSGQGHQSSEGRTVSLDDYDSARMIKKFRLEAKELAEQVQDDLKQGLAGRRDLGELTSHIELLSAHSRKRISWSV